MYSLELKVIIRMIIFKNAQDVQRKTKFLEEIYKPGDIKFKTSFIGQQVLNFWLY